MQWFYIADGQRVGPVDEDELRRLAREGRISPATLVWNASMGEEWAPASTVPGLFAAPPAAPVSGRRGTVPNAELMRQALASLSGKWAMAVGVTLLYQIVMGGIQGLVPDFDKPIVVLLVALVSLLVVLTIAGPMITGWNRLFLKIARRENADVGLLFSGFKIFRKAFWTYALYGLYLSLWSLLVAIPGFFAALAVPLIHKNPTLGLLLVPLLVLLVVAALVPLVRASLAYSQTFFLLADHPEWSASELIDRSRQMMDGFKWKKFCLGWRFFGWTLLAILTCGIGMLWLTPYMAAASAHFYDDVRGED